MDLNISGDAANYTLVGQFANREAPQTPLSDVPVLLMAGDTVLGRTVTNAFGEFTLDYRSRKDLVLCLPLESQGTQIEVSLKELP